MPIDTAEEVSAYEAGGVLQRFAKISAWSVAPHKSPPRRRLVRRKRQSPPEQVRDDTNNCAKVQRLRFDPHRPLNQKSPPPGARRHVQGVFSADGPARRSAAPRAILLRVIGSPDPTATQIDGMGAATSTSKTVILPRATNPTTTSITCSARCRSTSLSWTGAAIAAIFRRGRPFAISNGLVDPSRVPRTAAVVRIWQANIRNHHRARAHRGTARCRKPAISNPDGDLPAAEVQLSSWTPPPRKPGAEGAMFPTGQSVTT